MADNNDTRTDEPIDADLWHVAVWVCKACLDGEPGECHTPGCIQFLRSDTDNERLDFEHRYEVVPSRPPVADNDQAQWGTRHPSRNLPAVYGDGVTIWSDEEAAREMAAKRGHEVVTRTVTGWRKTEGA